MSVSSGASYPEVPGDVETPDNPGVRMTAGDETALIPGRKEEKEEEDIFEDASDAGEVFVRRTDPPRPPAPKMGLPQPVQHAVSTPPHIKPEDYDGTTDWSEYHMYFEQLAELYGWDDERKAMILGISLKGEARRVLAGMEIARRHSYMAVTSALSQSFAPKELVHLHQAELKARKKRGDESMADLGRDIAKLVRLAYPTADVNTREVIGINAFLEALPGPASEMKLHVIKGRPRNLQEAVAHATEVDAVVEAENRKTSRRRGGDVRMVGSGEMDPLEEVKQLKVELEKALVELREARKETVGKREGKRSLKDLTCFECGEKGHVRRRCPKLQDSLRNQSQGNVSRRLGQE